MLESITSHPQFWMVVFLAWGIASDLLGASKTIKPNGVSQLLIQLITSALADKAKRR